MDFDRGWILIVYRLVGTNEIALQRDENSVFFNCAGEITYNHMVTWSETPIAVGQFINSYSKFYIQ